MSQASASPESKLPPMLSQYLEYKRKYADCLVLFQVGDFYEVFFEDAHTVSRTLNLTLTSRDRDKPNPIPMAGVPIAVIDGYLDRLVSAGHSVALVSQSEAKPSGRGMVERRLDRIVTPGVRIGSPTDTRDATVLAIYPSASGDAALAMTDVQSGEVWVSETVSRERLRGEIARIAPAEIILPRVADDQSLTLRTHWIRDVAHVHVVKFRDVLHAHGSENGGRNASTVPGYAGLGVIARKAVQLLVSYVDEVTVSGRLKLRSIAAVRDDTVLQIDAGARAHLELVQNVKDGTRGGTLFEYMDRTVSAAGSRLLKRWILQPLAERDGISGRLDVVATLLQHREVRVALKEQLRSMADLERLAARIDLGLANPREVGALRDAFIALPALSTAIRSSAIAKAMPSLLQTTSEVLAAPCPVLPELQKLVDQPPAVLNEGGIFRSGVDEQLDRLRHVRDHGAEWIAELEATERARTGISSLKIRYNAVFGYFIEITRANLDRVPPEYVRKQTTANAERYITPELREREREVLGARDEIVIRERVLFEELKRALQATTELFRRLGEAAATLDVLAALSELAESEQLVRPEFSDGADLLIDAGRHPVIARTLGNRFIPNALTLHHDAKRLVVLTGPNMGGKSTFLRQAALIVIMAQLGSYVPARSARIGLVDRIFARIGASDDVHEGESTFMVEMREMSQILSQATERSLVLVDEIGRGTATTDGLAIAQAVLEWMLLRVRARTLFATHFHELTRLEVEHPSLVNLSVSSVEEGEDVIFTHEIRGGAADRSYGIEVAKLAGLPPELLARARDVLTSLTAPAQPESRARQLPMFPAVPPPTSVAVPSAWERDLRKRLTELDPDGTSPREALEILYTLKTRFSC